VPTTRLHRLNELVAIVLETSNTTLHPESAEMATIPDRHDHLADNKENALSPSPDRKD
jgi:hypothetical protein